MKGTKTINSGTEGTIVRNAISDRLFVMLINLRTSMLYSSSLNYSDDEIRELGAFLTVECKCRGFRDIDDFEDKVQHVSNNELSEEYKRRYVWDNN